MNTDARLLPPEAQEILRRKAVDAVENGMSQVAAAKLFGVSRQAVRNWLKARHDGGEAALQSQKRGPKQDQITKLKGHQAATIVALITDNDPEQLKLPFVLWTADAVRLLIQRKFKVSLSVRSVRRYLAKWGFTPQKPVRRAYEHDDEAVRQWLEEDYPAIATRAKAERAHIYWGDEMGVRSDHQAGRSYSPKGKTPVTRGTGKRFGCNIISALTNRGHLCFSVFKESFTIPVFIEFLRRLIKQSKRKVYLIVDSHPVHRSKKVKAWLAQNTQHISLFYLPGYSPELNPDEMLNHDVKANAVGRKRAKNQPQLMGNVRRHLEKRKKDPETVARFFHEKSVRYAAA
jgi:transposase